MISHLRHCGVDFRSSDPTRFLSTSAI